MPTSKVYVLVAVQGQDPPEATVLGVFSTPERAQARQQEIDTTYEAYRVRVSEAGRAVAAVMQPWLDAVQVKYWGRPVPTGYGDRINWVGFVLKNSWANSHVATDRAYREGFFKMAAEGAYDGPPPPELPDLIPPHDGPTFHAFEMSIQEADLDG